MLPHASCRVDRTRGRPSRHNSAKEVSFFTFSWEAGRWKKVFSECCGVQGTGYGLRGTGRQWLATCNSCPPHKGHCRPPQTYYKLTEERLELFTFRRNSTRLTNDSAVWKASLKWGGRCGIRERAMTQLIVVRLAKVTFVRQAKVTHTYAENCTGLEET